MRRDFLCLLFAALATDALAVDFRARDFAIFVGGGKSVTTWHGQASFRSIQFEIAGDSLFVQRWIPGATAGASITYHDIRQARSWFGYTYGDPNDSVRAESASVFVRRAWKTKRGAQPFVDIGSGPMWSNRRVPAATSRFNFYSQLGIGADFLAQRHPVYVVLRLSHISNLHIGSRNPGVNLTSLMIGTRVRRLRVTSSPERP